MDDSPHKWPPLQTFDPFAFALSDREIKRHQRNYLRFAGPNARKVLDIGSGRGQFLDIASDAGFSTYGIEREGGAVRECRQRGHTVLEGDALDMLRGTSETFDYVLMSHIIEHVEPAMAEEILQNVADRLTPGGVLVIITPNTQNLAVGSHLFWLDPTHIRPYPDLLLAQLLQGVGLEVVHLAADEMSRPKGIRGKIPARGMLRGIAAGVSMVAVGRRPS